MYVQAYAGVVSTHVDMDEVVRFHSFLFSMSDLEWAAGVLDGTVETHGATGRRRRGGRRDGRGDRGRGASRGRRRHASRGRQQHAGQGGTGRASPPGSETDAWSRAVRAPLAAYKEMATGDPVMQMKISNLELLCKSEALMAWGPGRHYDRCLALLNYTRLAQSVTSSPYMTAQADSRHSDGLVLTQLTGAVLMAYELGESPAERRQRPVRWIRFELPQFNQFQDSGECAAWFTALFVFLETLKANRSDNLTLDQILVGLPPLKDDETVPGPMHDIFTYGMSVLFKKLVSLGEVIARFPGRLTFEFRSTVGYEVLHGLWTSAFAGRAETHRCATREQKMAFLMGLHHRLGANSPVFLNCRDTAELILQQVERLRLEVIWSR